MCEEFVPGGVQLNIRTCLSSGQSALLVDCLRLEASKGKVCECLNVKGAKAAWMAGDLPLLLAERRRCAKDRDALQMCSRMWLGANAWWEAQIVWH
jgi:predicted RNA-binding protein YlxR (DUF448 family)